MQKENSVIKDYIMSSEIYLLDNKKSKPIETMIYHLLLKQNMELCCLFLLRR